MDTAGESETNTWVKFSGGPPHMDTPVNINIHQLCACTGSREEDLPGSMTNRDGWLERESAESMLAARQDNDDDIWDKNGKIHTLVR